MSKASYFSNFGGLPAQDNLIEGKAVFKEAYIIIPHGVICDIVSSLLPGWEKTRSWIVARPLSGFSETFSHYLMELESGGGSSSPEPDNSAEAVLFIVKGQLSLELDGKSKELNEGSYAYIPCDTIWTVKNATENLVKFHWIRKSYEFVDGLDKPDFLVVNEQNVVPYDMPNTNGRWSTTRFFEPQDLRHDMHVNIVNILPGAGIPFPETHVMEHGIYILQGRGLYYLNGDWVEVEAGDFLWLRAFCPQACQARGTQPFRYLLYKDVNRHVSLKL